MWILHVPGSSSMDFLLMIRISDLLKLIERPIDVKEMNKILKRMLRSFLLSAKMTMSSAKKRAEMQLSPTGLPTPHVERDCSMVMMVARWRLNKRGERTQHCLTPFSLGIQSVQPPVVSTSLHLCPEFRDCIRR